MSSLVSWVQPPSLRYSHSGVQVKAADDLEHTACAAIHQVQCEMFSATRKRDTML